MPRQEAEDAELIGSGCPTPEETRRFTVARTQAIVDDAEDESRSSSMRPLTSTPRCLAATCEALLGE